jgi:hypothetical protein
MFKRNRGVVVDKYKPWHQLYRRCELEDLLGGRLIAARVKYDNVSVNWSKFSRPWDVIFDNPGNGIVGIFVFDLPTELPKELSKGAKLHSFEAEHVPEEENYSHSEIKTYRDGEKLDKPDLPKLVKKEFRAIIADRSRLLLAPKQ